MWQLGHFMEPGDRPLLRGKIPLSGVTERKGEISATEEEREVIKRKTGPLDDAGTHFPGISVA